jgi:hypothetical protein
MAIGDGIDLITPIELVEEKDPNFQAFAVTVSPQPTDLFVEGPAPVAR